MEKTKIIIIRHGESLANAEGIYLGHTDWDLSPLGKEQAQTACQYLADVKIDEIYSSDLIRAYNTALPHAKIRNLKVSTSKRLREIFLGDWECQKVADLEKLWDKEFNVGWRKNFGICTVPGGESTIEAAERFYNAVKEIAEANIGKTILIASHAAVIRAFWGKILKIPPEELAEQVPFPKNASCTTVIFDGEELLPVTYGDTCCFDNTCADA